MLVKKDLVLAQALVGTMGTLLCIKIHTSVMRGIPFKKKIPFKMELNESVLFQTFIMGQPNSRVVSRIKSMERVVSIFNVYNNLFLHGQISWPSNYSPIGSFVYA